MTSSDAQFRIAGFVDALQLPTPPERVDAIRALLDKGFRFGAAIDFMGHYG